MKTKKLHFLEHRHLPLGRKMVKSEYFRTGFGSCPIIRREDGYSKDVSADLENPAAEIDGWLLWVGTCIQGADDWVWSKSAVRASGNRSRRVSSNSEVWIPAPLPWILGGPFHWFFDFWKNGNSQNTFLARLKHIFHPDFFVRDPKGLLYDFRTSRVPLAIYYVEPWAVEHSAIVQISENRADTIAWSSFLKTDRIRHSSYFASFPKNYAADSALYPPCTGFWG